MGGAEEVAEVPPLPFLYVLGTVLLWGAWSGARVGREGQGLYMGRKRRGEHGSVFCEVLQLARAGGWGGGRGAGSVVEVLCTFVETPVFFSAWRSQLHTLFIRLFNSGKLRAACRPPWHRRGREEGRCEAASAGCVE